MAGIEELLPDVEILSDPAMLIFKIVPRAEWEAAGEFYQGSAHDRADGFLHFSTGPQLAETLRLYYADQDDLLLVAADDTALGDALKYEYAPSRNEDFPHLFGALPRAAVKWARPIAKDGPGNFILPEGA
jgi:uncharacterized protein (DUF952 family)